MNRMFGWIDGLSKRTFWTLVVAAIASLSVASVIGYRSTEEIVTVKVSHKERIHGTDKSPGKYLVFGEDETFEIVDSPMYGQFRSSDLYGRMRVGESYRCTVIGWRIPVMSSYRTIVKAEKQ